MGSFWEHRYHQGVEVVGGWNHGTELPFWGWRFAKVEHQTSTVGNVGIIPNPSTTVKPDPTTVTNPTRSRLITYQIFTQIHQDTSDSVKLEVLRCVTLQTNLTPMGVNHSGSHRWGSTPRVCPENEEVTHLTLPAKNWYYTHPGVV